MSTTRPVRPRWYAAIYAQVLVAVALAVLLGWIAPHLAVTLKPLGDGFIRLGKMIIAPVIFCTVTGGIAGVSSLEKVGRVGLNAPLYFIVVASLALPLGLAVAELGQPGPGGDTRRAVFHTGPCVG